MPLALHLNISGRNVCEFTELLTGTLKSRGSLTFGCESRVSYEEIMLQYGAVVWLLLK